MQKDSRFFDDLAKLASGATGTFMDMKREMESVIMDKVEKLMVRMHLVSREEFEVVKLMAQHARAEQEKIAMKLAELEKRLESMETVETPRRKPSQN